MESLAKDYAAGFAAGIALVLTGHPFDTIKVKLQTQNTEVNTLRYRNAFHCAKHILRSEGFRGLYKGATSSFIGVAVESSVLFGAYSQVKSALQGGDHSRPQLVSIVPSAAVSGACISMILCPTELVKCRLQVQTSDVTSINPRIQRYNGPLDCALKIVKQEGVRGLFRGGFTTFLRESIGNAMFFTTYELVRYHMLSAAENIKIKEGEENAQLGRGAYSRLFMEAGVDIVSGGLAGTAFWCAVLPLDVAKTRMQTAAFVPTSTNPFHHLHKIFTDAGFRGIYAGIGPTLVRAFPANAAAMLTWELTAMLLGVRHYAKQPL